jgi:hypothetical protein
MILPLPHEKSIGKPFCDYLNLTSPLANQDLITDAISPYLDILGMSEEVEGLFREPLRRGTFKIHPRGKVCIFGASGAFLDALRGQNLFNQFLAEFGAFDHRISMMHVSCDYGLDAPPVIDAVYALAKSGELNLTRKAVSPRNVSRVLSPGHDGRDTGTVYLGSRKNADVWAKVYDKGHEAYSRRGEVIGQVVRVEVAVQSDVNATLRDASLPSDIFYHFASRSLVQAPSDYSGWLPHGSGFSLGGTRPDWTPYQRAKSILDCSLDISRFLKVLRADYGTDADAFQEAALRLFRNRIVQTSL